MVLTVGWFAPFFSNSGYGSEAISYLLAFQKYLPHIPVAIRQFAEPEDMQWSNHNLPPELRRILRGLTKKSFADTTRVVRNRAMSASEAAQQAGSDNVDPANKHLPQVAAGSGSAAEGNNNKAVLTGRDREPLHHQQDNYAGGVVEKGELAAICHSTPDVWHEDGAFGWGNLQTRCPPPSAKIRIGRTMFETDTLPSSWVPRLEKMDYILVPTKFHFDIWRKKIHEYKLRVLHEAVDTEFFSPTGTPVVPVLSHRANHRLFNRYVGRLVRTLPVNRNHPSAGKKTAPAIDPKTGRLAQHVKKAVPEKYSRHKFGAKAGELHHHEQRKLQQRRYFDDDYAGDLEEDVFHQPPEAKTAAAHQRIQQQPKFFLAIGKWEKRKGFDVLIKAFQEEFRSDVEVFLLIKTSLFHNTRRQILQEAFGKEYDAEKLDRYQHVIIDETPLSSVEMVQLYREATAVVLPSRGEGWGRGHAEAMSMAKPLIAVNWSGPSEYMRDDNSLAVNYTLVRQLDPNTGMYSGDGHWAEPSVSSLRQQMRWVLNHEEEAKQIGMNARRLMVEQYSLSEISKQLDKLLTELNSKIDERNAKIPVNITRLRDRDEL
ncbi:unnamed protein product [Amoebophrya sp. A120]|nr:unnamed protein product [Amoebophrya sp. A120]|eukprot:GSA120T00021330001.1